MGDPNYANYFVSDFKRKLMVYTKAGVIAKDAFKNMRLIGECTSQPVRVNELNQRNHNSTTVLFNLPELIEKPEIPRSYPHSTKKEFTFSTRSLGLMGFSRNMLTGIQESSRSSSENLPI